MTNNKENYVDGFVLVVSKDKIEEYKKIAKSAKRLWMKHGAINYKECMGEDLHPKPPEDAPEMKPPRSFVEAVGAKPDETVWFSFIVFESRKHRDEVNARVMKDMEKEMEDFKGMPMPFDMGRVFYGGFSVEV